MKKKNQTPARIKINTCLLLVLGIVFAAMTFCATSRIQQASRNFQPVSDAPGLCYEESEPDESGAVVRDNSYICTTEYDESGRALPVSTADEQTLFIYDRITLSSLVRSGDLIITVAFVGSIFTISTLVAAFIYWNHNRAIR